ncbi:hypothetical protein RFI_32711, partial [Reticulomyxa filosa]
MAKEYIKKITTIRVNTFDHNNDNKTHKTKKKKNSKDESMCFCCGIFHYRVDWTDDIAQFCIVPVLFFISTCLCVFRVRVFALLRLMQQQHALQYI